MKDTHCTFKRLNANGRCIAPCHHNIRSDKDCTGKTGKTMELTYIPSPGSKEVKV